MVKSDLKRAFTLYKSLLECHRLQFLIQMQARTALAWGTYSYSAGTLAGEFMFSTFVFNGPETGVSFDIENVTVTSSQLTISNTEVWSRDNGVPGDIVGRWERSDL